MIFHEFPQSVIDPEGGKYLNNNPLPKFVVPKEMELIMEEKLGLTPGELSNDDPYDPDYIPATKRREIWQKFIETGEV